jgi:hypothetical protein
VSEISLTEMNGQREGAWVLNFAIVTCSVYGLGTLQPVLSSSFDLGPAIDSVMKAGPVACVLLLWILFLIRQLNKRDVLIAEKDNQLKQKDDKIEKLQGAVIVIGEKQAEVGVLVKDRLRRIEYALQLRRKRLPSGERERALPEGDDE